MTQHFTKWKFLYTERPAVPQNTSTQFPRQRTAWSPGLGGWGGFLQNDCVKGGETETCPSQRGAHSVNRCPFNSAQARGAALSPTVGLNQKQKIAPHPPHRSLQTLSCDGFTWLRLFLFRMQQKRSSETSGRNKCRPAGLDQKRSLSIQCKFI